ncbi:MAG: hypothetical protein ACT4OZ_16805 [Gemmatimonadota bacterium]
MKHQASPWAEMNNFHSVLRDTWHPARQNDLRPLRTKSSELAGTARAWAASTPPAACSNEKLRSTVFAISSEALAIGNLVLSEAPDAELLKALTALHDKFAVVEKGCTANTGMKHH